jgi:biopolymer transport protein ExbD
MAMKGAFQKKSKISSDIPSSSLADIAFLLLIFFMVSTNFPTDTPRHITWVKAEAAQKITEKKKDILNIWVEKDGSVYINDQQWPMPDVHNVVAPLYVKSQQHLVPSIRGDADVPYRYMDELQKQLVAAGIVRVVFAAELENKMQRERR